MKKTHSYLIIICLISISSTINAFAPTNFFLANDPFYLPPYSKNRMASVSCHVEGTRATNGRNGCGDSVNVLKVHHQYQSVLPMLRNPSPMAAANGADTLLNTLRRLPGGATTGLHRGLLDIHGTVTQIEGGIHAAYTWRSDRIPGEFTASIHQPIVMKEVSDICINDLTKPLQCADIKVQEFICDLNNQLKTIGCLSIDPCSETGFGDTVAQLAWQKVFYNIAPDEDGYNTIKKVQLSAKAGVSCPLGSKKDEDKAFSMALGHDGHWGIPVGLGIETTFHYNITVGMYTDFLVLLEHTKERRLKTDPDQTELFLINKGFAKKDPGLTWQFEGFVQWQQPDYYFTIKGMYQLAKHYSDRLTVDCGCHEFFCNDCINTAESLREWHVHNIVVSLGQEYPATFSKPAWSLFYKYPLTGERMIDNHSFGGQLHFRF